MMKTETSSHEVPPNDPQNEMAPSGFEITDTNGIPQFETLLKCAAPFQLRRAVERLREGLFDPLGVKLLSSGDSTLNQQYATQMDNLEKGVPAHLCVCGAYGQGKSHTLTYIRQRALEENYVVSYMNLDPREVPFHNQKQVYRALMENITFPDAGEDEGFSAFAGLWRQKCAAVADAAKRRVKKVEGNKTTSKENKKRNSITDKRNKAAEGTRMVEEAILDIMPEKIPHRFKSILTAMGQQTETIPHRKRHLKKHIRFKPREFPWILNNAFMGKEIPVFQLRNAVRYRQVSFYKEESLACKDDHLYMEAIQAYGELFQNMGYRGWVVLFDEAESIMLSRIVQRSKSYALLHELFCPETAIPGLFPVFAFTHDFFTQLRDEDFERIRLIRPRKARKKPLTEDESKHTPSEELHSEQSDSKSDSDQRNSAESDEDPGAPVGVGTEAADPTEPDESQALPKAKEVAFFERNYNVAWKEIHQYRLRDLTAREWHLLIGKLIRIHALAYRWEPDTEAMDNMIFSEVMAHAGAESRMKLKLIVNLLDLDQQSIILSKS